MKTMKTRLITTAFVVPMAMAAMFASPAQAASGYTINDFHLYAGPGHSFPRLETVPENARVHIFGCNPSFTWCDVSWGAARGWIDANGIETPYAGRRMTVAEVGASLSVPVISSTYYRDYRYEPPRWRELDEGGDRR